MNISHIKWLSAFPAVLLAAGAALAQDFTAGKTPAQLFASDCSACHRLPNGLGKKYDVGSLSGFLREHYTTKPDSAGALAKYVMGFANLRATPTTAPSAGDTVAAKPAEEPKARRRTSNLSGDGVKRPRSPVAAEPPAAAAEAAAVEAVVQPTAARSRRRSAARRAKPARRSPSSMIMRGRAKPSCPGSRATGGRATRGRSARGRRSGCADSRLCDIGSRPPGGGRRSTGARFGRIPPRQRRPGGEAGTRSRGCTGASTGSRCAGGFDAAAGPALGGFFAWVASAGAAADPWHAAISFLAPALAQPRR